MVRPPFSKISIISSISLTFPLAEFMYVQYEKFCSHFVMINFSSFALICFFPIFLNMALTYTLPRFKHIRKVKTSSASDLMIYVQTLQLVELLCLRFYFLSTEKDGKGIFLVWRFSFSLSFFARNLISCNIFNAVL